MSFEGFTRPFQWKPVWPPAPARPVAPEDKPEQGVAVLRGLGGKVIDLTRSETSSWSKSRAVEKERTVARERVYQKKNDGTIEKENFVDVERVQKMTMQEGDGTERKYMYAEPAPVPNIETLEIVRITNQNAPPPEPPTGTAEEGSSAAP